jgi:hypothetical protein
LIPTPCEFGAESGPWRVVPVQPLTRGTADFVKKQPVRYIDGVVTFAEDLAEMEPEIQDYVIAHELLPLRYSDYGRRLRRS